MSAAVGVVSTLSAGYVIYNVAQENMIGALSMPLIGMLFCRFGKLKSRDFSVVGGAVMCASVIALPGSVAGYAIYTLGGKTIAASALALITGAAASYKAFEETGKWAIRERSRTL
jgi:hypothetical protein